MDYMKENEIKVNKIFCTVVPISYAVGLLLVIIASLGIGVTPMDPITLITGVLVLFIVASISVIIYTKFLYSEQAKYFLSFLMLLVVFQANFNFQNPAFLFPLWFVALALIMMYQNEKIYLVSAIISFAAHLILLWGTEHVNEEMVSINDGLANVFVFILVVTVCYLVMKRDSSMLLENIKSLELNREQKIENENMLKRMQVISNQVYTYIENVRQNIEDLLSSSEEVAQSAYETSNMAHQTLNNTHMVTQESHGLYSMTEQAREYLQKTESGISHTQESYNFMEENTHTTISYIRSMSKLLTQMEEISSQVDLLSINTSIEAAKAGQVGAGFSVIADEIKRLSEKTTSLIKDIQKLSEEALEQSSKTNTTIIDAQESLDEVSSVFHVAKDNHLDMIGKIESMDKNIEAIEENVRQVTSIIEDLSSVSEEQACATEEINKHMKEIETLTSGLVE